MDTAQPSVAAISQTTAAQSKYHAVHAVLTPWLLVQF
jgi:hypothetical protein